MPQYSIIEYCGYNNKSDCGYCKSNDTSSSHGLWAHILTVQDYQILIDRGWRRSGKYCYKPVMSSTCCPAYTIKCSALEFHPTKSQKKVLKRMHNFLAFGNKKQHSSEPKDDNMGEISGVIPQEVNLEYIKNISEKCDKNSEQKYACKKDTEVIFGTDDALQEHAERCPEMSSSVEKKDECQKLQKEPKPGLGADQSKPVLQKAKKLRQERRLMKLMKRAETEGQDITDLQFSSSKTPVAKSLEEFINEPLPPNPAHKLEIKLIPITSMQSTPNNDDFTSTVADSYELYKRYQMTIHKEKEYDCEKHSYYDFLVMSPLKPCKKSSSLHPGFGSFHQQYWLDDKLIAVGVIDILPSCVSSVYLYYDPEYSFLSLGTYAALREIAFVRELHKHSSELKYYYMGFYIHSCPKMRYKGQFAPSFLLCPEVFMWFPIEYCIPKLDQSKYSRFEDDQSKTDEHGVISLPQVTVLYKQQPMLFEHYCFLNSQGSADEEEVLEYSKLVGQKCAYRMLLYRSDD